MEYLSSELSNALPEFLGHSIYRQLEKYEIRTYNLTTVSQYATIRIGSYRSQLSPESVTLGDIDAIYICNALEGDMIVPISDFIG